MQYINLMEDLYPNIYLELLQLNNKANNVTFKRLSEDLTLYKISTNGQYAHEIRSTSSILREIQIKLQPRMTLPIRMASPAKIGSTKCWPRVEQLKM